MGIIDGYSMMIVSKYFSTIDDFLNVEAVCSKYKNLLKKFHYNPIPLSRKMLQYFPNLETLHIYSLYGDQFSNEEFYQRVYWTKVPFSISLIPHEKVVYKNLVYTCQNMKRFGDKIPKTVSSLGDRCFCCHFSSSFISNQEVSEFYVPNNITALGTECFSENTSLKTIILGKFLFSIGSLCFAKNCALTQISLPDSLRIMGKCAFGGCKNLQSLTIPTGIERLQECCFDSCISLSQVLLPTTLTFIGEKCFKENCTLEKIEIPQSVTEIGGAAFANCNKLREITLPEKLVVLGNNCFCFCLALSRVKLPEKLDKIEAFCFWYCGNLSMIVGASSLSEIKESSFGNCVALTSFSLGTKNTVVGKNAFKDAPCEKEVLRRCKQIETPVAEKRRLVVPKRTQKKTSKKLESLLDGFAK